MEGTVDKGEHARYKSSRKKLRASGIIKQWQLFKIINIINNKYLLNGYLSIQYRLKGKVIMQAKVLRQVSIYYLQEKKVF